jgi:hypothetical protein
MTITVESGVDHFGTPCFHVLRNGALWTSVLYFNMALSITLRLAEPLKKTILRKRGYWCPNTNPREARKAWGASGIPQRKQVEAVSALRARGWDEALRQLQECRTVIRAYRLLHDEEIKRVTRVPAEALRCDCRTCGYARTALFEAAERRD